MKANNGSGNIIERDEWMTPNELFLKLSEQYQFNFDCCATYRNAKCPDFSNDFLSVTDTEGYICWMNPPFSKASEMFKHFFKVVKKGMAIYRADNMETDIWQKIILPNATWIFIFDKRIGYDGFDGNSPRFGSALVGLNIDCPTNISGNIVVKK